MGRLVFASGLFLLAHLGISSTPLRGILLERLGRNAYLGLYSVIALATLVYLILAYTAHPVSNYLWLPSVASRWFAFVVVAAAFVLMIGAFVTKNPTSVGQEGSLGDGPRGMIRITRHPFQWAVVLWSTSHVVANGDVASIVFFGTFGCLSLAGTFLIDVKKARESLPHWEDFAAVTSNIPFAAIANGRNRLALGELAPALVGGLVVYAIAFWGHQWIAGIGLI